MCFGYHASEKPFIVEAGRNSPGCGMADVGRMAAGLFSEAAETADDPTGRGTCGATELGRDEGLMAGRFEYAAVDAERSASGRDHEDCPAGGTPVGGKVDGGRSPTMLAASVLVSLCRWPLCTYVALVASENCRKRTSENRTRWTTSTVNVPAMCAFRP